MEIVRQILSESDHREAPGVSGEKSSIYLHFPVYSGPTLQRLEILIDGRRYTELMVPVDAPYLYTASVRMPDGAVSAAFSGDLPASFFEAVTFSYEQPEPDPLRPFLHYTPGHGWCNDPNGLVFRNGIYHFYHQYNPCGTEWNNMSWGHSESRDLLHFSETETVLLPSETGAAFSGCAIRNDHSMLGLPADTLLYFYTVAGAQMDSQNKVRSWCSGLPFTQNLAYSTDGGRTLRKPDGDVLIGDLGCSARDPKVFWNEECGFYNMVLYLDKDRFAIAHSFDLRNWEKTQVISFANSWECPDLFQLSLPGSDSEKIWVFWSADGYYYFGRFDGYRFHTDHIRHEAYRTALPYAAQTWSGTEDRLISVPWLRTKTHGNTFTGMYGLPVELSAVASPFGPILQMKPVREFFSEAKEEIEPENKGKEGADERYERTLPEETAVAASVLLPSAAPLHADFFGVKAVYDPDSGILRVNGPDTAGEAYLGPDLLDFLFVADRGVLEVFAADYTLYAAFDTGCFHTAGRVMLEGRPGMEVSLRCLR
ncbi:MAG: glycoside hydrolase family 32 protein [Lachnospiraceae bacterium]|nr:glycoside hydrolase family 32 protein [Lachnospiraceae bacterium]